MTALDSRLISRLPRRKVEPDLAQLRNAWLSPDGELVIDADDFDPSGAWHELLAQCIVRDMLRLHTMWEAREWVEENSTNDYCYTYLEELGWVRLCRWVGHGRWVVTGRLRAKQRKVINEWCLVNGMDFDKAVDIVP